MGYSEKTYFNLRSRLDAFQTMALAYCLNAPNDEEAQARMEKLLNNLPFEELHENLKATPRQASLGGGGQCPDDCPYRCGNECLPYPCPTN